MKQLKDKKIKGLVGLPDSGIIHKPLRELIKGVWHIDDSKQEGKDLVKQMKSDGYKEN